MALSLTSSILDITADFATLGGQLEATPSPARTLAFMLTLALSGKPGASSSIHAQRDPANSRAAIYVES